MTVHKAAKKYLIKEIPKKTGGTRTLYIPNKKLKELQTKLANELSLIYFPRNCAFAYIKGRNIKDNAEKHFGKKWLLRVDLRDFFESINFGRVRGLFIHLGIAQDVATALAQLCTFNGILPQGSPASPVISNMIASGLDKALSSFAREHNCFYTRYSDDLSFSCNRKIFPKEVAYFEEIGSDSSCMVGINLKSILEKQGFSINDKKTYLSSNASRKVVTGLVINEKINVNKIFIRNLRVLLHQCTLDPEGFYQAYRVKNKRDIFSVLKGKVEFLGFVRGYDDFLYKKYALQLSKIKEANFIFNKRNLSFGDGLKINIYCEGVTDFIHLKNAISFFKSIGEFTDLDIVFMENNAIPDGDNGLLEAFKSARQKNLEDDFLSLFLFDKDVSQTLTTITKYNAINPHIKCYMAMILPLPHGLDDNEQYCIEHMYKEDDRHKIVTDGRRLHLKEEFNEKGFHKTEKKIYTSMHKKSLVADSDIFCIETQKSVGLTKKEFASLITSTYQSDIEYINFRKLFIEIQKIKNEFYKNQK
jgi:RNA-directed DNA polymerase